VQITAVKNMGTKSGYNARTWTKHGKLPYIEYDNAAPVQPDKPDTGAGAGGAIKAGSVVRVKQGAKTYTGGGLASFVYERDHVVSELNGDRAVITYGGVTVAASCWGCDTLYSTFGFVRLPVISFSTMNFTSLWFSDTCST